MNELEALRELCNQVRRFKMTPPVDDDFPEVMYNLSQSYEIASSLLNSTPANPLPLREYGQETNEINRANGWHIPNPDDWEDDGIIPTFLMLIVSEVSEALEAFRKNDEVNFCEELADVFIRLVNLANGLGIDLDTAVKEKLEKNRGRGHKHGGKRV